MFKHYNNINTASIVLTRPRITEKATALASTEAGVYTFEVSARANKVLVADAVKKLFKVTPVKVNIINTKAKTVFRRGKVGTVGGIKKAMIYLKKGDKIDLI
ncbi:MAG: 50S ribosomal protein L23 [bacterium]|nr:50S ribosomal protein L23 [bacterium]